MYSNFFHLKLYTPTKTPRRDLTLTVKIALLEKKIKNHLPNTSHCQLTEITVAPKSTTARAIQQQEKMRDKWKLIYGQ
jgi:hypothetical protein